MANSKESGMPAGFGDDLEQLTLLRDILFGPQIRKLQEQIDLLRGELEKAQDGSADPNDPAAIYSRLKADITSTKGDGEKEMKAQRDYFDSAVKKQSAESTKQFKAVAERFESNAQQEQARNNDLAQAIGVLLDAQEAHNAAVIKELKSAQTAQAKQLKKLQKILGAAETEAKQK